MQYLILSKSLGFTLKLSPCCSKNNSARLRMVSPSLKLILSSLILTLDSSFEPGSASHCNPMARAIILRDFCSVVRIIARLRRNQIYVIRMARPRNSCRQINNYSIYQFSCHFPDISKSLAKDIKESRRRQHFYIVLINIIMGPFY